MSKPTADLGYVPALDGLRALAVAAVVALHSGLGLAPGGAVGVDLFFVLSGFLITSLLAAEYDRHGRIDVPFFYVRRALRLYPALIATVAVTWLVLGLLGDPVPVGRRDGRRHHEGREEEGEPDDDGVRRRRLRADRRAQERQHHDDAREGRHHDDDGGRDRQDGDQRDKLKRPLGEPVTGTEIEGDALSGGGTCLKQNEGSDKRR